MRRLSIGQRYVDSKEATLPDAQSLDSRVTSWIETLSYGAADLFFYFFLALVFLNLTM